MAITGTIISIESEKHLESGLRKKSFVLHEEGPFPNELLFEVFNERITLLDRFKAGDRVSVEYHPRGFRKEKEDGEVSRWNSLRAYKIEFYSIDNLILTTNQSEQK